MDDSSDGCSEQFEELIAKIFAILLIALACYLVEFVWNPNNNSSLVVRDEIVAIDGISCDKEPIPWRLKVVKTWYNGIDELNHARLLVWRADRPSEQPREIEIKEKSDLKLTACEGELVSIAWVYTIGVWTPEVHFRFHQGLEFYVVREAEQTSTNGGEE